MLHIAMKIKNYVRDHCDLFPNFAFRSQVIQDFYKCSSESDYRLFIATYNRVIINILI